MSFCFACGYQFPDDLKVYRSTECPSCGRDVKVCLNCKFYSPGSNMDCREHISEAVQDKDKSNFCDFFELSSKNTEGSIVSKADKAKNDFKNLFGDE